MPHPRQPNHTDGRSALVPLLDEQGQPVVVALLQLVFRITAQGRLQVLPEQPEIELGGRAAGPPEHGLWLREPQTAVAKPGTDVVLHGHARAPKVGTTQMAVGLRVGPLVQKALVFGHRRLLDGRRITEPEPFESIALSHQQAFGGWDRRHDDPAQHCVEARNPVGLGFRDARLPADTELMLPAIERPEQLLRQAGDAPAPVGFGFVGAHWQPRAAWAGTCDAQWMRTRMPLLPTDFDRRHWQAASPGLASSRPLLGDEPVTVLGTTPGGRLDFQLPGLGSPLCQLALAGRRNPVLRLALDLVLVDTDAMELLLLWRGHRAVRQGLHEVKAAAFHLPALSRPQRRQWRELAA